MRTSGLARAAGPRMLVLVLAVVAGCGGVATQQPSSNPPSARPTPTATPPSPTATPDDFDLILAYAAGTTDPGNSDLGRLWAEVFDEIEVDGQKPYVDPTAVRSYRGGEVPPTDCTAGSSGSRWRENALWCPSDGVIAYDEDWFRDMSARFSPFAAVFVLAHEWGHHVQSIVGEPALDIQAELQADCFSGLYLTASGFLPHGGEDSTAAQVAMEVGLRTWFEAGDEFYADSEWIDPGLHGSPQQRMMAAATGFLANLGFGNAEPSLSAGIPWCLGYDSFIASHYIEVGPYAILLPPGREGAWQGLAYGIPAFDQTSLETSDIVLAWLPDLPLAGGATTDQMAALWNLAYPNLKPITDLDITDNAPFGTAVATYYDNEVTLTDGTLHEESGVMALLSPASAEGGLLIVVSRGVPAPTDTSPAALAQGEEQIITLFQLLDRVCSPDETDEIGAPNLEVACLRDLQ
jgi:uncharacterized protein